MKIHALMALPNELDETIRTCRHLLRHIDDPRALASNELAAPILEAFRRDGGTGANRRALMHIRSLLRIAANDLVEGNGDTGGRRRKEILLQCDLSGEPHKFVATTLGLSMRQFYRERETLIESLAENLPERMRVHSPVRVNTVDITAVELAHARSLYYGGDPDSAASLLRSIARGARDPRTALEAWSQLVTLLIHYGDIERCGAELRAMQSYAAQYNAEQNDFALCREIAALEQRNYLEACGALEQARVLDRSTVQCAMQHVRDSDRHGLEFAARALTAAARRDFICGETGSAQTHLEAALPIASMDEIAVDARIKFMVLYGVVLCILGTDRATASSMFSDAAILCERYGLSQLAVVTVLGSSVEEQMRGDTSNALRRVRALWPVTKRIGSPLNHVHVCLRIAELEMDTRPRTALAVLEQAMRQIRERTYEWKYAEFLCTQAHAALKDSVAGMHSKMPAPSL